MKLKLILSFLATALILTACETERITASNEVTSTSYEFNNCSGLQVSSAFDVFVQFSETEEEVRIEANSNLQDKLVVQMEGNTLVIRPQHNLNIKGDATLKAYITTTSLTDISLSGATDLVLEDDWQGNDGSVTLSGASSISGVIGFTEVLVVEASGSSEIDFFGSARELKVQLSGSSNLKDYDLQVQQLDAELSGSSSIFLSVDESIRVSASGASDINYRGDAVILSQNLSGGSEINKRG